MAEDSESFWEKLVVVLEEKGWSQRELSRITGISTQGIQRWKKPGNGPRVDTLAVLAQGLEVSADRLVPGTLRTLRRKAYPSLERFLSSAAGKTATNDEIEKLLYQRFDTGDPGEAFYYGYLQTLRGREKGVLPARQPAQPQAGAERMEAKPTPTSKPVISIPRDDPGWARARKKAPWSRATLEQWSNLLEAASTLAASADGADEDSVIANALRLADWKLGYKLLRTGPERPEDEGDDDTTPPKGRGAAKKKGRGK